jgi:hypothetical protein
LQLPVFYLWVQAPPNFSVAGAAFIVPKDATGVWAGQEGRIASFKGFGRTFDMPLVGWMAWIEDEGVFGIFDNGWSGGAWPMTSLRIAGRAVLAGLPPTVSIPVGRAVIDVESRRAIDQIVVALRAQGLIR